MNKKLIIFISILILLFITFIYFVNREYDYSTEYVIDNFNIHESYNTKTDIFTFTINEYTVKIKGEYNNNHELIDEIKEYKNKEEYSCLEIKGDLKFYNICIIDDNLMFDNNININIKSSKYNNINIYETVDKKFLIWNYNSFTYIGENNKTIDLFDKDVYNPTNFIKLDNKLFVPSHKNEISFNEYYLINFEDGKVNSDTIKVDINLDIHYTSYNKEILSIYDDKINKEYVLDISDNTIRTKNNIEYSEKELSDINIENNEFFILEDSKLKYINEDLEIGVTTLDINKIIYQNEFEVIFLKESKLYYFNIMENNITLLMEKEEWNYNYNNLIYIY